VDWATGGERPVFVDGQGLIDVTLWKQKQSMTMHLVNLTNPMTMKGPFRELIAIGEQKVRVKLPDGMKPKRVHLLKADRAAEQRVERGWLHVRVPSVLDHEVIAIDV
jgi:hypothetical protein